jgi:hypothetical protein
VFYTFDALYIANNSQGLDNGCMNDLTNISRISIYHNSNISQHIAYRSISRRRNKEVEYIWKLEKHDLAIGLQMWSIGLESYNS